MKQSNFSSLSDPAGLQIRKPLTVPNHNKNLPRGLRALRHSTSILADQIRDEQEERRQEGQGAVGARVEVYAKQKSFHGEERRLCSLWLVAGIDLL